MSYLLNEVIYRPLLNRYFDEKNDIDESTDSSNDSNQSDDSISDDSSEAEDSLTGLIKDYDMGDGTYIGVRVFHEIEKRRKKAKTKWAEERSDCFAFNSIDSLISNKWSSN